MQLALVTFWHQNAAILADISTAPELCQDRPTQHLLSMQLSGDPYPKSKNRIIHSMSLILKPCILFIPTLFILESWGWEEEKKTFKIM